MRALYLALLTLLGAAFSLDGQVRPFTHADTLRGSYTTPGRAWWDVSFYDLRVAIGSRAFRALAQDDSEPATKTARRGCVPRSIDEGTGEGYATAQEK